jgi:signal transduction histidine kinase
MSWEIRATDGRPARIDPLDLMEALGALAENAARHARGRVAIDIRRDGESLRVAVTDDGPGAPESALGAIRDRGVRLDMREGGDGLGLSIAGEIAEAAGGRLALRNTGSGLEAALLLPAAPGSGVGGT